MIRKNRNIDGWTVSQKIPQITLRRLESLCDKAEAAYWQEASRLPEWQRWKEAVKAKRPDQRELRQAFYHKADQLPQWMAYQSAWLALNSRYSHHHRKNHHD
jgi:hypothetical protein